jgi:hypothetical protein
LLAASTGAGAGNRHRHRSSVDPSHTDNALADGNVVQLTPSTVVTVNGREVPLEALTPGSNIILESMAPTTRNGRYTNSAIPCFRDRYGRPVDRQNGVITLSGWPWRRPRWLQRRFHRRTMLGWMSSSRETSAKVFSLPQHDSPSV